VRTTQRLQLAVLIANIFYFAVGFRIGAPWWFWIVTFAWALLVGTWAFSAGWDAARPQAKED
jgi:hypothetical protein